MKLPVSVTAWLGKNGLEPNGRWYEDTLGVVSAVFCWPDAKRMAQVDSAVIKDTRNKNLGFEEKRMTIRNLDRKQRPERSNDTNKD
ncbi:MAG TPA: hypothetical protein VKH81_07595 [Candidatus Angelobacter sp.]|nr:hypothetical protein [Candidatus Angelobacter sp.]